MRIRKYAIYDLKGNFLNGGVGRTAKRDAVTRGEFNGWKDPVGQNELSDSNPTD